VNGKNARILVISDQHFPYNHPDIIKFLAALKKKYKPDRVVNIGDELDYHSISFHDHIPDLLSPSDELQTALNRIAPLFKLFPQMDILESNHGSLVYRKAVAHGLPAHVFKTYREILGSPKGWRWHADLTLKMSNGKYVYFCHGKSADVLKLSQSMGMCAVQGHFHEKFEVRYWGNSLGLFWGAIIGCLIENKSLAFAYNKLNLKRPVIGCMMILNGLPHLTPMVLNSNGRWNGFVP
jgi:hypothetical protein